jgi:small conductance mechanosensitive channel
MQRSRWLFVLVLILGTWTTAAGAAVSDEDLDEIVALRDDFNHIDLLLDAVDGVREWDRDGINTRIDELGLRTLNRLNTLAARLLADETLPDDARRTLVRLLDRSLSFSTQRTKRLEERAAAEREDLPKFEQSAQADIARAFIQDLVRLLKLYLEAQIDQIEIRDAAGMETATLAQVIRTQLNLIIERLAGQIQLDAMSIDELRARLADDPLDEDLKTALELVKAKQTRSLNILDRALDLGERLSLPVAEHRSLLIRERGAVGVELLRGDVFSTLWREQFSKLHDAIVRQGPDILFRLLLFAVVLVFAWMTARLVRAVVGMIAGHNRFGLSVLLRDTLVSVSGFAVLVAGTVIALAAIGVSLGPIFAGIGVIGILVGLAVQDSLGNLAAGAMILINRPFDVDDHIQVAGANGLVKRMNWLATTILTFDNQVLVVPNRRIWGDTIVNFTASHVRRVDIKVNFAYSEDPDRVRDVLLDLLHAHENVLAKPEPQAHMVGMEDSALAIVVKPWVKTEDYWTTLWDLNRLIKQRFDAEGIEIPFPQRVVTLLTPDGKPRSLDKEPPRD